MEKAKFLEAKKQNDIIECCNKILIELKRADAYEESFALFAVENLLDVDKHVFRSFVRWVENEKQIAEQKLKEV